jgi:hypothetical protein
MSDVEAVAGGEELLFAATADAARLLIVMLWPAVLLWR